MVNKPRYDGIDIHSALDSIASAYGFDADALIDYAALDPHGGYHPDYDDGFPIGSIWRVEGQILYALVRALYAVRHNSALRILELGTHHGCSATHLAQALHDADRDTSTDFHRVASVVCVDVNLAAGDLIPAHLTRYIEFVRGDMFDYLAQPDNEAKFDFILEDGSHGMDDVETVWRSAYTLLKPGGLILSHDAEHFIVGTEVREGIARAGYFGLMPPARTYLIEPSDCGFAIYRKPTGGIPGDVLVIEPGAEKYKNDALPTVGELLKDVTLLKEMTGLPTHKKPVNPPDLSAMTIPELRTYANARGISIPASARTKGAIIAVIEAV